MSFPPPAPPSLDSQPVVQVIRSARRTRTVSARHSAGKVVVRIPATMSAREEKEAVATIVAKLKKKSSTVTANSDQELMRRATQLNAAVLGGRAQITSVRWSENQRSRWGSCTISTGEIRISTRLKSVPEYVLDAVLVHELTHTFIPGHGPEFWEWADRAPQAERAKGYLEAYQRFA